MGLNSGKIAEYKFVYKAMEHGFIPCFPCSDAMPYDVVLDRGEGQPPIKVQVKGTFSKDTVHDRFSLTISRGNDSIAYTKNETDFIVCYVDYVDVFYIIPIDAIGGRRTLKLYPHRKGVGQFEHFRERWGLLKE